MTAARRRSAVQGSAIAGQRPRSGRLAALLLGLGAAGLLAGLGVAAILIWATNDEQSGAFVAVAVLIGWAFIGAGLAAWWQRPDSRVGALMVAVGFAWSVVSVGFVDSDVFIVGQVLNSVWIVLLFQLLLTFPSGRLESGYERLLAAGAWTSGLLLQVPPLLFLSTPDATSCEQCPPNPILIADNRELADLLFAVQAAVAIAAVIGLLVLLVRRWRRATPAQRGAFTPLLWAGGVVMALLVVQLIVQVARISDRATDVIFFISLLPFASVPFAFLIGLLRTQLSREAAVGRLIEHLGAAPVGERDLRDALAEALGDPTLELAYWLPEGERYVDAEGRRVVLPDPAEDGRSFSVVEHGGRPVAAMVHDRALAHQHQLVRSVGGAAALALENERLDAELRARLEDLRASRARLVEAADSERRRLERDLHDGAQQSLITLALALRMVHGKLGDRAPEAAGLLEDAMQALEQATRELRELARGIHPAVLTDRGLRPAIRALTDRMPIPVDVLAVPDRRLPVAIESAAYFVAAEALTNVAKYAQARKASIAVTDDGRLVVIEVRDDGVGGASPDGGSGLSGLSDRVSALDGRLILRSPPGEGTTVRAEIPDPSR